MPELIINCVSASVSSRTVYVCLHHTKNSTITVTEVAIIAATRAYVTLQPHLQKSGVGVGVEVTIDVGEYVGTD